VQLEFEEFNLGRPPTSKHLFCLNSLKPFQNMNALILPYANAVVIVGVSVGNFSFSFYNELTGTMFHLYKNGSTIR